MTNLQFTFCTIGVYGSLALALYGVCRGISFVHDHFSTVRQAATETHQLYSELKTDLSDLMLRSAQTMAKMDQSFADAHAKIDERLEAVEKEIGLK